ncbi:recombinase family protein [Amycolatopsis thermoflava]|uniref:recombinase family protein n=1 Tax=Amycolatopsis thermoflava TaxID=84480 RepID=UPI00364EABDD
MTLTVPQAASVPGQAGFPVVLYARVSQVRDERSKSTEDQLAALRAWAEREGWQVIAELRDDDVSASRFARGKERAGWDAVMAIVGTGQARALLTWEFSRGTRDRRVYAELADLCEDTGTLLGYGGRLYNMADDEDGFSTDLSAALAVRESRVTSKRVRRAVDARAARGAPHGSVAYGYRRVIHPHTGAVLGREIDPETGPIVREIIRRLLDGSSSNSIAVDLNRRGVPTSTGKQWIPANLAKLALRPVYAGLRVYHGEVLEGVKGDWPPLISEEEHHRLVAMFASPERDKFRNPTHVKHLGPGLFRCGRCGGRMRVLRRYRGSGLKSDYSCRDCLRLSRRQAPVDQFVEAVIVARLSQPDAQDALTGGDDAGRAEARAEVARLRAEMETARQALKAGRLTPLDMADFREGWEPRMAAAERAAQPAALPDGVAELIGPDAAARWAAAPIKNKRAVLDALMTVTILPTGSGRRVDVPSTVRIDWK